MLFLVFVIMVFAGIFLIEKTDFEITGLVLSILGVIFCVSALMIICTTNFGSDVQEEALKNQQESFTYRIESGMYKDDLNLLDKDFVTEVKEWNTDVIYYKSFQRNFWIGIFIPNIYDEIETIDYKRITK